MATIKAIQTTNQNYQNTFPRTQQYHDNNYEFFSKSNGSQNKHDPHFFRKQNKQRHTNQSDSEERKKFISSSKSKLGSLANSKRLKQVKNKVLVIILSQNQPLDFQEFCKQLQIQAYYQNTSQSKIILLNNYKDFKKLIKLEIQQYFILSSQKLLDNLSSSKQIKQNWVVYGTNQKGSKKTILDNSNVVYYTKNINQLRNKLESRGFIKSQQLFNKQKSLNVIPKDSKKRVKPSIISPIQTYIQDSMSAIKLNSFEKQSEYKIEHTSNSKTVKDQNIFININRVESTSFVQPLHEQSLIKCYQPLIQQKISHQKYENKLIGPGSNRIIDLADYEKFSENGLIVYRKRTPQRTYIRSGSQRNYKNLNKYKAQESQFNNQYCISKQMCNLNPKNATLDQKVFFNDQNQMNSKRPYNTFDYGNYQEIGLVYQPTESNQKKELRNIHERKQQSENAIKQFHNSRDQTSYLGRRNNNRTSDQIKNQLDRISSIPSYQLQSNPSNKIPSIHNQSSRTRNSKMIKSLSGRRPLRLNSKSLGKLTLIKNRSYRSDKQNHIQKQKSVKNKDLLQGNNSKCEYSINHNIEPFHQIQNKSLTNSNSLSSRNKRPFLKSMQKILSKSNSTIIKKIQMNESTNKQNRKTQQNYNDINNGISVQQYSQFCNVYKFQTPNGLNHSNEKLMLDKMVKNEYQIMNFKGNQKQKCKIQNQKPNYQSKQLGNLKNNQIIQQIQSQIVSDTLSYNNSQKIKNSLPSDYNIKSQKRNQELYYSQSLPQQNSVLFLIDHLLISTIIQSIQSINSPNDSIYKFKNLAQLKNQIKQSQQVYDFIFIFLEQFISNQQKQKLLAENIKNSCFFIEIRPQIAKKIQINSNILKIQSLEYFSEGFEIIRQKCTKKKQFKTQKNRKNLNLKRNDFRYNLASKNQQNNSKTQSAKSKLQYRSPYQN